MFSKQCIQRRAGSESPSRANSPRFLFLLEFPHSALTSILFSSSTSTRRQIRGRPFSARKPRQRERITRHRSFLAFELTSWSLIATTQLRRVFSFAQLTFYFRGKKAYPYPREKGYKPHPHLLHPTSTISSLEQTWKEKLNMSSMPTIPLGGSASHIKIGRVAFGCMGMSWAEPSQQTPDEQAFETIKAAVDAGSNFLNSKFPPSTPSLIFFFSLTFFTFIPFVFCSWSILRPPHGPLCQSKTSPSLLRTIP